MRAVMPSSTSRCCCIRLERLVTSSTAVISPDGSYTGTAEQVSCVNWREEVVVAPHRHRPAGGQAGAHAVGAGLGLAPDAADAQAERADLGGELGRRHHVHDHAVGVGQHDRRSRRRRAAGTAWSSRSARSRSRRPGARGALRASTRVEHDGSCGLSGCRLVLVEAAAPRLRDDVAASVRCKPRRTTSRMRSAWSVGFAHGQASSQVSDSQLAPGAPIVVTRGTCAARTG